jgi:hypothetical protein
MRDMTRTERALLKAVTFGWILAWGFAIGIQTARTVEGSGGGGIAYSPYGIAYTAAFAFTPALVVLLFLAFTEEPRQPFSYNDYEHFGSKRSSGIGTTFVSWIGGIIASVLAGLITTYLTGK